MNTRGLILVLALALSACAADRQAGYRPVERSGSGEATRTTSFEDANAQCWNQAYTLLGGNAMDSARSRAYDTCMNDRGWYDPRASGPPQPRGATTPGSR